MTVKEIVYLLSTKQGLTQDDLANKIGYIKGVSLVLFPVIVE